MARFLSRTRYSLTRLSASCPSVNDPVLTVNLIRLDDGGIHKSMEDLLDDVNEEPRTPVSEVSAHGRQKELYDSSSSSSQSVKKGESIDTDGLSSVINVADTSDDLQASDSQILFPPDGDDDPFHRKQSWMSEESDQVDINPHGSNYQEHSHTESDSDYSLDQTNQQAQPWATASDRKRVSWSSLTGGDKYGAEDIVDSATGRQRSMNRRDNHATSPGLDADNGSDFLEDSTDSNPGGEMPIAESLPPQTYFSGRPRLYHSHRPRSDFSSDEENSKVHHIGWNQDESPSDSGYRAELISWDAEELLLQRSRMTEFLSTPGGSPTPETPENGAHIQRERQESQQYPENECEEKDSNAVIQEDSGRKPTMIARMHSKYKAKKSKKESRNKEQHNFVAISFSSKTSCYVCHQDLAKKPSLRCDNCLVSVHESNCKDQLAHCDKSRNKVHPLDVARHGSFRSYVHTPEDIPPEYESASVRNGLTYPEIMKENKSAAAPGRSQLEHELAATWPHRRNLPLTSMPDISESFEALDGGVPLEISWLYDEPDLLLDVEVSDIWSTTVDKKKKLTRKDIKRQDTIWELINTEKNYVKRLKIMQKIFAHLMVHDLNYTADQVDRLFPRLNDLVELHVKFLRQLLNRQAKNEDRSVDDIGDILLDQFQGITADKMKSVYGVFCAKHTEAMQLYKELVKHDRKFQNFAKYCNSLSVCEKREISDFILGVTFRLSKYPILIQEILKHTKDKKDREDLSQALLSCKDVVQHVDEKVAAYEKLMDIQSKMDSKTVIFKGMKFKRQDFNAGKRELIHAGNIGWMSARGRVYNVLVVVLTDLVVFLQKNEQKYTFFLQDNKACVVPLHDLVVREKRDVRGSLGIYIMSQNREAPEMYELVCQNKVEREKWIKILQDAIKVCPLDTEIGKWPVTNPGVFLSNETEQHKHSEHDRKVKLILKQLHEKDEIIKECCDEKNRLMLELLELSTPSSEAGSPRNSQEIESLNDSVEVVHAAIQEASRLTDILQGTGTQLSRSTSSAGEHYSSAYTTTTVPKRAETFSGFDSNYDSSKISGSTKRFTERQEDEQRLPTDLHLNQQDRDQSVSDVPNTILASKLERNAKPWEKQIITDVSSNKGSLEELATSSLSHSTPASPSQEQMTSIYHLVQYLNTLMNLTSKQCTTVESLRVELGEAKEEIAKLSADVHSRRTFYRHDQLEELRNLQENISQEKQKWERAKLHHQRQREKLETEWREIDKEKWNLRVRKEDLKRRQEILQFQVSMLKEQGFMVSSSFDEIFREDDHETTDINISAYQQRPIAQWRSANADFYDSVPINDQEDGSIFSPYGSETVNGSHQSFLNNGSPQNQGSHDGMDTHNEQRLGNVSQRKAEQNNITAIPFQQLQPSAIASPALSSDIPNSFPGQAGLSGFSRTQSVTATPHTTLKQQKNSNSVPYDLSRMATFSEPKGHLSFSALSGNSIRPSPKSRKSYIAPQPGDAPGGPRTKEVRK